MRRQRSGSGWLGRAILALVVAIVASLPHGGQLLAGEDELVAFVNKDISVSSVSSDELRQMFLGVRTSWPGGGRVTCVNASDGTRSRDLFRSLVLRMSAAEEKRYWEEQKVQGKGQEPPAFANTVKAVFRLKGGVSYGMRSEVRGDVVRIVATVGK